MADTNYDTMSYWDLAVLSVRVEQAADVAYGMAQARLAELELALVRAEERELGAGGGPVDRLV